MRATFISHLFVLLVSCWCVPVLADVTDGHFVMQLREQVPTKAGEEFTKSVYRTEKWKPSETAIIVCDMWDSHHCYNAVQRVNDVVGRMNELLTTARSDGAMIIHAPSSCMEAYVDHPGRKLAQQAPAAKNLPSDIGKWCYQIPQEEKGQYPIDQSDGGEDDDPKQHEAWAKELAAKGLNPKSPWKRQVRAIDIHDVDAISDSGVEVWNLLESRGIKNVILLGVHTNMCVLGRPFGLRQMSKNGRNVVLMRDLTDTMYNPAAAPFVNHHTGTDLIVQHIERHVCPTVLSTDIIGGKPHRFFDDKRPTIAMVISEFEYETYRTLPEFAMKHLGKDYRVVYAINDDKEQHSIDGLSILKDADVAVISAWRRTPPPKQLQAIRDFCQSGKSVIGIRTSSHAFVTRYGKTPDGAAAWPEFDQDVFGCEYTGHHGNHADKGDAATKVWVNSEKRDNPILNGLPSQKFAVHSWLYKSLPLKETAAANVLLWGEVRGKDKTQPVAWIASSEPKVFYTSLGSQGDFQHPAFQRLLANAIGWAAGK